jgi:hypothetical protein
MDETSCVGAFVATLRFPMSLHSSIVFRHSRFFNAFPQSQSKSVKTIRRVKASLNSKVGAVNASLSPQIPFVNNSLFEAIQRGKNAVAFERAESSIGRSRAIVGVPENECSAVTNRHVIDQWHNNANFTVTLRQGGGGA